MQGSPVRSHQAPDQSNGFSPGKSAMSNFGTDFGASGGRRLNKNEGSRIKVAVRIRPLLDNEINTGQKSTNLRVTENSHQITIVGDGAEEGATSQRQRSYKFDQVFSPQRSQPQVYEGLGISKLINRVIDGYHGTIFAYGQTGSGKTYTMEGSDTRGGINSDPTLPQDKNNMGITQRGIHELFDRIAQVKQTESTRHFSVFVSFLQIYNEKVFDLLNPSSTQGAAQNQRGANLDQQTGLRIRWTKKDQFVVENLYVFETASANEVLDLYRYGARNRILASHNLNEMSSRSHCIFSLTIESQDLRDPVNVTVSKLQLVDLAGSEKQSLTGTKGQQAKESIDINKSLHVLRKVITALTDNQKSQRGKAGNSFVPYRESKLTCLLKQSLGGNSYTLMVACLTPSDRYFEENLSTLNYASRASQISNLPTKNVDPKLLLLNDQKHKIVELEKELRNANVHIQTLSAVNLEKDAIIDKLQRKLQNANQMVQYHQQNNLGEMSPTSRNAALNNLQGIGTFTNSVLPDISGSRQDKRNDSNSPGKSGIPTTMSGTVSSQFKMGMTGSNFMDKAKQEAQAERLIHSVNAVTELLKANTDLREKNEKVGTDLDETTAENSQLHIENQWLRERVELVEGILKNNSQQFDDLLSDPVKDKVDASNTEYGRFGGGSNYKKSKTEVQKDNSPEPPMTVDNVYNELIHLRKMNRTLEDRIKHLEMQNFNMTAQGFNKGGKHMEPTRPMFKGNKNHVDEVDPETPMPKDSDDEDHETNSTPRASYSGQKPFQQHSVRQGTASSNLQVISKDQIRYTPGQNEAYGDHQNQGSRQGGRSSRDMLPRPHHNLAISKANSTQYQTFHKFNQQKDDNFKSRSTIEHGQDPASKSYQPVPDGRFYTKANFFTLADRQEAGLLSDDEVLDNGGMRPIPHHSNGAAVPFPKNSLSQPMSQHGRGRTPGQMSHNVGYPNTIDPDDHQAYNIPMMSSHNYDTDTKNSKFQLQPISDYKRQQSNPRNSNQQYYGNQQSIQVTRAGVSNTGKKLKKGPRNAMDQTKSNMSMVLVMSNVMEKRNKIGKAVKRRGNSSNPTAYKQSTQPKFHNEFYF